MTQNTAASSSDAVNEEVAGPVVRRERIGMIDVLRGFALLGILMLNVDSFVGPESEAMHDIPVGLAKAAFVGWHASLDYAILTIKWIFFEGKMRALFAMLFGAGTVLLLQRIEQRAGAARAADIFHRRNMWLVLFGLLHGTLIWFGDILMIYGSVALLLLYPLRHVATRKLLVAGMAIWLVGGTLGVTNFLRVPQTIARDEQLHAALVEQAAGHRVSKEQQALIDAANETRQKEPAEIAAQTAAGRAGFLAMIPDDTQGFLGFYWALWTSGWMLEMIGAMTAGMGLFKLGFFSGKLSRRAYLTVALVGYAIAMPLGLFGVHYAAAHDFAVAPTLKVLFYPYTLMQIVVALANASTVILIARSGWLAPATKALAAVGRMAITNYLLTSILCRLVFSWGPWKLFGTLEFYQYLYVVGAVWAVNLVFSTLWLRHFAFGPMEWVWRSLTYWKRQPMRLGGGAGERAMAEAA